MSPNVHFEPGAKLNPEEQFLLNWFLTHISSEVTVLAESCQDGVMMADIMSHGRKFEFKTTSGNLNTLDTLLRHAAKQASGDCAIVNICQAKYSLADAKRTALRRMKRSGLREVYLLYHGTSATYLHLDSERMEENL